MLLKSEIKNHCCCDTGQSGQVPLVLPNEPKAQFLKTMLPKTFCRSFLHLNRKQKQTLTKVSNKI